MAYEIFLQTGEPPGFLFHQRKDHVDLGGVYMRMRIDIDSIDYVVTIYDYSLAGVAAQTQPPNY